MNTRTKIPERRPASKLDRMLATYLQNPRPVTEEDVLDCRENQSRWPSPQTYAEAHAEADEQEEPERWDGHGLTLTEMVIGLGALAGIGFALFMVYATLHFVGKYW